MFVATLVAAGEMGQGDIDAAVAALMQLDCKPSDATWIDTGKAADIFFAADPVTARSGLAHIGDRVDVIVQPMATREKRLLVADMDSTMITVECIDELADYAGIKPQIAEITERAMQGELDFAQALRARVALLKGLDDAVIDRCLVERVAIMPGARALVQTMAARGAHTVLVSGGFTRFTGPVSEEIGFARNVANVLLIENGVLSGEVADPIVDSARKLTELQAAITDMDLDPGLSMAVGDGANDIPMIQGAGLGVAYHAKEKARAAADAEICHGDLSVLLYAQGIAKADWVAA